MSDVLFDWLQARAADWKSTDPLKGGDAELIQWLLGPRPGEADYVAPETVVRDEILKTDGGDLRVRAYLPKLSVKEKRPLLVWCHGGSFFSGDLDMPESDAVAREICVRADAVVVTVDYRLALGLHYPAPSDDVVAAFDWVVATAAALGADEQRITIGGASAGGNLAAGAALRLRDRGTAAPASVLLLYPILHPVLPEPSEELAGKIAGLSPMLRPSPDLVEIVVENYLGVPASQAFSYGMPGVEADLRGFPPTMIINSEYDGVRASGELFADQLRQAGVPVTERVEAGVYHGHLGRGGGAAFLRSVAEMAGWVRGRTDS
ncbi:alpha/beta hydrolase [Nocardia sp. NPDC050713]|uniref:alpha/beta hydrolase n=1 Tax=Nocardia sp. NPDC050713 TaxID=3154511 RepID=UPI0033E9FB1C